MNTLTTCPFCGAMHQSGNRTENKNLVRREGRKTRVCVECLKRIFNKKEK